MSQVKLASRIEGEGPALLLLHGLFGSARNWYSVQRQLADRWQVHGLDLRNHGSSDWAQTMSYPEMAGDVLAYLDAHQLDNAVVLGHSMGGKVAMSVAQQAPGRVRALVVVDIAPVAYAPTLRAFLEAMQRLDLTAVASRRAADTWLTAQIPDPAVRGFLLQNLVSGVVATKEAAPAASGAPTLRWRLNLPAIAQALAQLGEFPAHWLPPASFQDPVAAIYGELSPYMQASYCDAFRQWFPHAQLHGIPNAGHWVHAEQPAAFGTALEGFLATL